MQLNPLHLQVLRHVVQAGGVSAAAREMGVSQPTLSIQLRQLAQAVGATLFEQVGRRLQLTAAGREALAAAQDIEAITSRLSENLRAQRKLESGELHVAMASTAEYFLPRMLGMFCRKYPGVDARMAVLNREQLLKRFADSTDDFVVMTRPPQDERVISIALLANPLVLIASRDHPLALAPPSRVKQVQPYEFVEREPGSGTRLLAQEFFATHGVQMKWRIELGSNEAVKQAVAGGLGLAVLSALTLHTHDEASGVRVLRLPGMPIPARWHAVYWRGKRLSPAAVTFLEHLRQGATALEKSVERQLLRLQAA
jgi:LysR family transcriptional regulator, low CO2-responsive transcriptional regulator